MLTRNRDRLRLVAATSALVCVATLSALEPNAWQHRQSLAVPQAGVTKIALPPSTLDLARAGLEDLRLIDSAGREVPYVIERAAPSLPPTLRAPATFRAVLRDAQTQLLIETGATATTPPLTAITLATMAPSFMKAALLESSADGRTWETLASGVPVFRQFGTEQLRLELPRQSPPPAHVRITLEDARTAPIPFVGAQLAFAAVAPPPFLQPLPVRIVQREEFGGETLLTLDLGARHVPLADFEFVTGDPLFARTVTFAIREVREDVVVERALASGTIYRVAADGLAAKSRLRIPVEATVPTRELLVHIVNHDSPPLALDEVRAQQRPVWLVFRAAEAGEFRLLTGNPDVPAPRYDLAALASSLRAAEPGSLASGVPELNPGYRRVDALADTPLLGGAINPSPWDFRKPVQLVASGVHQLELDLDVLAGAGRKFADLRLVRDKSQIPYLLDRPSVTRSSPLPLTSVPEAKRPGISRWELKLPRAGVPVLRLTLNSPTAVFRRQLRLFEKVTDEQRGSYERALGEALWIKVPEATGPLDIVVSDVPQTDTLFLETDNGDNPPLVLAATVQVRVPVARLLFKTDAGPLTLYYGNRHASAPRYDLALVAKQIFAADKNIATLAAEERARPDRWGAGTVAGLRGGVLFWGVLGLVVVVLLAVVAHLLPKSPPPSAT